MNQSERMLRLFSGIQKLNDQRHLSAIRNAFIASMPIMIAGAYAVVVNQMPIAGYQQLMLNLLGERWTTLGGLVYNGTTAIVSLMVVFSVCSNLVTWYNNNQKTQVNASIGGMVGLACYAILTIPAVAPEGLPFAMTGVTGLFVAMVTSVLAAELFIHLTMRRRSALLSDDPSPMAPQAFAAVVPAAITIALFALVRTVLIYSGVSASLDELVLDLLARPYQGRTDSMATAQLFNLSTHLMWLFGIHGNNVLDDVAQNIFVPAMEANVAAVAAGAAAPNLFTKTLFDVFVYMGGSGTTLALLIALLIFGKSSSYRTLLRYAAPNSIFNINEPFIFGIPIVLNPIYAIPFVLTPVVTLTTTTLAMQIGLVPYTIVDVSWATPILISGYTATGSMAGALLQLFNLALGVALYAPFVRIAEQMTRLRYERAYKDLNTVVTTEYSPSSRRLIRRMDEVGSVARRIANQMDSVKPGEMYLNYQPIVDAATNTLHSVEALLRWNHPEHGFINPMVTVALAEETGRINKLGLWIMEQAVVQRAKWNKAGLPDFHVSVNVSTHQLDAPDFHARVKALLERHEVPGRQIQIEVTETAALVENENTRLNLAKLHGMGITIAMDDFGVGHSSLLYLRTQPISTLKIDGSLSREVLRHPANLDIIATIYNLCCQLDVEMIVEFVDNKQQLIKLMEIGARYIQGYYFAKPMPGDELLGYLVKLSEMEQVVVQPREETPPSCVPAEPDPQ